ncbi:MAG TPA: response regulator [Prolixibacteraceae bacterium]|nr:response regulator [Prolixibacteraceae bacterium]
MTNVRIAVVEDELIIAESIVSALQILGYTVFEPATHYTSALELIQKEKPDLVFIDIRLAGSRDGIDLGHEINSRFNIPFIFLTSNSDPSTIERAKKTLPAGYLLKPFTKADLYSSVEIALYQFESTRAVGSPEGKSQKDFFLLKQNKVLVKVFYHDIMFINSQHVYLEINTRNGKKHLVRSTMNDYLNTLPGNFIKVHRSYIVNTECIEKITSNEVVLKGVSIPVSREYRKDLLAFVDK